ncbi:MAG: hypothetical protein WD749_09295, partial [Phycisphaerales bacterium]
MNCRTCNYALWNLREPRCPECGADFRPSDYRFVPGAIRYCCPHCAQAYYGTSPEGHLIPRDFACITCGHELSMDLMVLSPAAGIAEESTAGESMPWFDERRGFFRRWFATIGQGLILPTKLIRLTPLESSVWSAFGFSVLTLFAFSLVFWIPMLLLFMVPMGLGGGPGVPAMLGMMAMPLVYVFGVIVVGVLLWLLASHVLLLLGGSVPGGLRRTAQCFFYSSPGHVLFAVPCLGFYFGAISWVWVAVSAILMIRHSQKVSGWRASFAVLTPPLLVVAGLIAWAAMVLVPAMNAGMAQVRAASAQAQAQVGNSVAGIQARSVAGALATRAAYPKHAVRLVTDGDVAPTEFILTGSVSPKNIPVGRTNLMDLYTAAGSAREREVASAEAALPPGVVAHRLGNFVFTYHGISPRRGDGRLWLFIAEVPTTPPPTGPGGAAAPVTDHWLVGLKNGTIQRIEPAGFPAELMLQNARRASASLPPLPPPPPV